MSSLAMRRRYTVDEYLALEETADYKNEFFDGQIFAMAGGSGYHSQIANNVGTEINVQAGSRGCIVYQSDMRIKIEATGLHTYADVSALCGTVQMERKGRAESLLNPSVIVEVLSPTTESYDRGAKWMHYQQLESLREYVLISQTAVRVERYLRAGDAWTYAAWSSLDDVVELPSIGVELSLRKIYMNVDLEPEPALRSEEPDEDAGPDIGSGLR